MVWTAVGLTAWVGATVAAAATAPQPSDAAERVLRTFAVGGGIFFAITFAVAAVGIRRSPGAFDADLYRRLTVHEVSDADVRRVTAPHRRIAAAHLGFGVVTTAMLLVLIGAADDRLLRPLGFTLFGLVVIWAVIALRWSSTLAGSLDDFVRPLGLRVVKWPRPGPNGRLLGVTRCEGERHGHAVTVVQRPRSAVTTVGDVVVTRKGNGAGRWLLEDLQEAEEIRASGRTSRG